MENYGFHAPSHQNGNTFLKHIYGWHDYTKTLFSHFTATRLLIFGRLAHRFKTKFCLERNPNWPQTIWWVHTWEERWRTKIKQSQTAVGRVKAIFASSASGGLKIVSLTQIDFNQMVCSLDLLVLLGQAKSTRELLKDKSFGRVENSLLQRKNFL